MHRLALIAMVLLTGCANIPVGSVALCVGVCRFQIERGEPQSTAAQIGGGLADLLVQKFSGAKK
jgi:hypothetical protein